MKEELRKLLIAAASNKETWFYGELANELGFKRGPGGYDKRYYRVLTEIGSEEFKAGRPLLNALVIGTKDHLPSDGFYKWYNKMVDQTFNYGTELERKSLFLYLQEESYNYWRPISIAA